MTIPAPIKRIAFYALVLVILVQALFPFYYAVLTSLENGQALFEVNYLPKAVTFDNYEHMLTDGVFGHQIFNSIFVATVVVIFSLFLGVTAAFALSRIRFRGADCCCSPSCRCRCFRRSRCSPVCSS